MRRDLARKVLEGCDLDEKVNALLDLIDLSLMMKFEKEESITPIPFSNSSCVYNHKGECWLNIPDSVTKCFEDCPNCEY